jgi:hypothetical protein
MRRLLADRLAVVTGVVVVVLAVVFAVVRVGAVH